MGQADHWGQGKWRAAFDAAGRQDTAAARLEQERHNLQARGVSSWQFAVVETPARLLTTAPLNLLIGNAPDDIFLKRFIKLNMNRIVSFNVLLKTDSHDLPTTGDHLPFINRNV